MSSNRIKIENFSKKAAAVALCFCMLVAQTGCLSTLIEIIEESDAEELVTDFIDAFLKDPGKCKYSKFCEEDPEFAGLLAIMFLEISNVIVEKNNAREEECTA